MALLLRTLLRKPGVLRKATLVAPAAKRNFRTGGSLPDKKYTQEHEWISLSSTDKNIATIGITEYAQSSLGQVVFVELPTPSTQVSAGEPVGAVESVKSASDILSPVTGVVVEANQELATNPSLINTSAEDEGWVCKVRVEDVNEVEGLMGKEGYDEFVHGN